MFHSKTSVPWSLFFNGWRMRRRGSGEKIRQWKAEAISSQRDCQNLLKHILGKLYILLFSQTILYKCHFNTFFSQLESLKSTYSFTPKVALFGLKPSITTSSPARLQPRGKPSLRWTRLGFFYIKPGRRKEKETTLGQTRMPRKPSGLVMMMMMMMIIIIIIMMMMMWKWMVEGEVHCF